VSKLIAIAKHSRSKAVRREVQADTCIYVPIIFEKELRNHMAGNGWCHDRDRIAKVNRMTFANVVLTNIRCQGAKSLSPVTRSSHAQRKRVPLPAAVFRP
jgi:hypothetical protein